MTGSIRDLYKILIILLATLMTAVCGSVSAAGVTRYDVELLVFEYLYPDAGGERLPEDPGLPDDWNAQPPGSSNFTILGTSQYRMANIEGELSRSRGYRPLLHLAWRQPAFGRSNALPVLISRPAASANGQAVTGTVTLSRARYLHLSADLVFGSVSSAVAGSGNPPVRLIEDRRMRSGEIHYIDNPYYGILALVTPVQAAATTEQSTAESGP